MEQQVNNVINFGIGCAKALSDTYGEFSERIRSGVSDLVASGEKSKDDASVRIRQAVYKATDFLRRGDKSPKAQRAG
jgi:hypothetical protein